MTTKARNNKQSKVEVCQVIECKAEDKLDKIMEQLTEIKIELSKTNSLPERVAVLEQSEIKREARRMLIIAVCKISGLCVTVGAAGVGIAKAFGLI